jgi:hypothetical protein
MPLSSKGRRVAHSCCCCRTARKHSLLAVLRLNEVDVCQHKPSPFAMGSRACPIGRLRCGLASPHSHRRESRDKCQLALSASSIRCRHVQHTPHRLALAGKEPNAGRISTRQRWFADSTNGWGFRGNPQAPAALLQFLGHYPRQQRLGERSRAIKLTREILAEDKTHRRLKP